MSGKKVDNFLFEKTSYLIRGACFEVYNSLGKGHKEIIYQNALGTALTERKIPYKIVLELKASEFLHPSAHKQLFRYLRTTKLPLGFLINFGNKLEIHRRVYFSPAKT